MPAERRRVLLLQGPMGPFFARLARELTSLGHEVTRVAFNAGDLLFHHGAGVERFRGALEELPAYLDALVTARAIDAVVLFGDGRPVHRVAIREAARLGLEVHVFEEGYLRPDWITLEPGGVNGFSSLPRDPARYRVRPETAPASEPVGATFSRSGLFATLYVIAMWLGRPLFPRYRHHRPLSPLREAFLWTRSALRKSLYRVRERAAQPRLTGELRGRFFLVPLQVHCDFQLAHSDYQDIETFALEVMGRFASDAPVDAHLVIKHHPMDRAYRDYTELLALEAARLGIAERVHYIHDQHLPSLLDAARGLIVMNSTVGLQALHHGTPVFALGRGIFVMPGLTAHGELSDFFRAPAKPDPELYANFRRYLLWANQANGSFAKRLPGSATPTGVRWHPSAPLGLGGSSADR